MPKQIKQVNPGVTGTQSLVIPITNVFDGNDYSAQLLVGSNKIPVNLILDTGSSTLAVVPITYLPQNDTAIKATTYAQVVMYGTGGWIGPVVNTSLGMGAGSNQVTLQNAPIAIIEAEQQGSFPGVDGIMGLAYNALNGAYDLKDYLNKNYPESPTTFPWPFKSGTNFTIFSNKFNHLLTANNIPQITIIPYFDELESKGVVANKFAFYTKRSGVNMATNDKSQQAKDPLNQGLFVLGGGEEQTDLYTGTFLDIDVQDDLYYNTNLIAVQVAGSTRIAAQPLQSQYSGAGTNSIIDSGTSILALSNDVYTAILNSLKQINPAFASQISSATNNGISAADLNLAAWPNIEFIFTGLTNNEVTLTCTPSTYWQVNYPAPGMASFQIGNIGEEINQSIFGLPLLNNYYTVFDRSLDTNGIVRFAPIN